MLDICNCISTVIINHVGLRSCYLRFLLKKEEILTQSTLSTLSTQEYSPDLTIKLTDKEYNQYVKKAGKIDRR